jgi:ABC-type proline/glycine betaine transport system permease subunit
MQNISFLLYKFTGNLSWLEDVYNTLPSILYAVLAVAGGAGAVYAVILGVNLAKSENDEKRKTASIRLRNTIIGVAVLLILVLFINLCLPPILHAFFPDEVVKLISSSI